MNPAQMRDTLIAKYPNRFRIPSDTEIKQEIGHSKLAISIGRIGLQKGTGETGGMYKQFLLIMTETYSIPLDGVPAKGDVKMKISAFKQKYKKEAITSVV